MKFSIAIIALFSATALAAPVAAPHGNHGQAAQAQGTNQGANQGANTGAQGAGAQATQGATTNGQAAAAGGNKAGKGTATQAQGGNKAQGGQAAAASASPAAGNAANANAGTKGQGKAGAAQGGNAAAPTASGAATPGAAAAAGESDAQAAQNWMKDTGIVSDFLNRATSLKGQAFVAAAQKALDAEKDELNHKAILDADSKLTNTVASASNVLATQGTFQAVVDKLQEMVNVGDSSAAADTAAINANRCKNVLPNIDVYLKAAGTNLKAVRPTACGGP